MQMQIPVQQSLHLSTPSTSEVVMTEQPANPVAVCQMANALGFLFGAVLSLTISEGPLLMISIFCLMLAAWTLTNWCAKASLQKVPENFDRNMLISSGAGLVISSIFYITLNVIALS